MAATAEFTAAPKRRSVTAEYKLQLLAETDRAADTGGISAILRREAPVFPGSERLAWPADAGMSGAVRTRLRRTLCRRSWPGPIVRMPPCPPPGPCRPDQAAAIIAIQKKVAAVPDGMDQPAQKHRATTSLNSKSRCLKVVDTFRSGHHLELAHVPPAATLFLHRKIGGMYLMAAKLRARVALRPMVEACCRETTVPR